METFFHSYTDAYYENSEVEAWKKGILDEGLVPSYDFGPERNSVRKHFVYLWHPDYKLTQEELTQRPTFEFEVPEDIVYGVKLDDRLKPDYETQLNFCPQKWLNQLKPFYEITNDSTPVEFVIPGRLPTNYISDFHRKGIPEDILDNERAQNNEAGEVSSLDTPDIGALLD